MPLQDLIVDFLLFFQSLFPSHAKVISFLESKGYWIVFELGFETGCYLTEFNTLVDFAMPDFLSRLHCVLSNDLLSVC